VAWRCASGNGIIDPCFSDPAVKGWVACPEDAFGADVIKLSLTKPLPLELANTGGTGKGNPWAIQLANGMKCSFLGGATFVFAGKRVNYGCTTNLFLAGSPKRSGATWTIIQGSGPKSKPKTVSIAIAVW
jgi:hypothetical protein